MPDEPKYTMGMARKLVKRELCADAGHEIVRNRAEGANGKAVYDFYTCDGCDVAITFTYPSLEEA